MGCIHGAPSGADAGFRIRSDAPDERGDGAYDHLAPAGCAWTREEIFEKACGSRGAHSQEGTRVLSQSFGGDLEPPEAAREDLGLRMRELARDGHQPQLV